MGVFVTDVRPRWSDMDMFGHVNHANMVTLLEEARVDLLFGEAARHGVTELAEGMVVARLVVDYRTPLVVDGSAIRVEIAVRALRAADITLDYTIYSGRSERTDVVAVAETTLVPYSLAMQRPRRFAERERDFLAGWLSGGKHG